MIENQEKTLGCLGKAFPKLEDSIDSFLKKKKKYINKASMKRIWEGKSRRQGRGMGEWEDALESDALCNWVSVIRYVDIWA